jgi:DNA helicase-2/ATP-dependent DNA helicase PcrA
LFGDENFLKRAEVAVYLHAFKVGHNPDDVESLKHLCVYLDPAALAEMGAIQNHLYKTGKRLSFILVSEEAVPGVKDRNRLFQVKQLYGALQKLSGKESSVRLLYRRVEELLHVKERLLHEKSEEAEEKLANIEALEDFIAEFDSTAEDRSLGAFNAEVLLKRSSTDKSSVDKVDPATVKLLTIHAGKGTEYPIVFLMGLEQGTLPDYRSKDDQKMEEERRNCYVAVTRTMEHLYLSWCESRTNQRGTWQKEPSQFLTEMLD